MQHSVSAADGLCETLLIQSFELVRRASFSRRAVDMLFSPARALPMLFCMFLHLCVQNVRLRVRIF